MSKERDRDNIVNEKKTAKKYGKYTYEDYLSWPDDKRFEIIDGVIYDMTPAPLRIHQKISLKLSMQFANYLDDKKCELYYSPFDVLLPKSQDEKEANITTVVQPDISVICDLNKLIEKGCKGAPDLIIEISSSSTFRKDMLEKFNLYEKSGVREYWLVRPQEKIVIVFKLGKDGRYGRPDLYGQEDEIKVGIFDNLEIKLNKVFQTE